MVGVDPAQFAYAFLDDQIFLLVVSRWRTKQPTVRYGLVSRKCDPTKYFTCKD
jgi:hypothetical protein